MSLSLFLHVISPKSCSSGSTCTHPNEPINAVYVIDPSVCLVYTAFALLRPKETLTFHTQGSSPSLSCVIVQLTSQSQPIMWEGLTDNNTETPSGLCEWGWWGGKWDVFLRCSRSYNFTAFGRGVIYWRDHVRETETVLCSRCVVNQLLCWSCDQPLCWVNSGVQRLSLKLVSNLHFNMIE